MVVTVTLNPCIDRTIKLKSFLYGSMNRMEESRREVSGKGINVSLALNNLGVENKALGFVFKDNKDYFLTSLSKLGLSFLGIEENGELRENIKIWNAEDSSTTEINQKGARVEPSSWEDFKVLFKKEISSSSIVALSGSLPQGLERSAYKELIEIANSNSVKVILDTEGDALLEGLKASPYLIKPNLYEFKKTFGGDGSIKSITDISSALIREKKVEVIVVSLGKDGALIFDKDNVFFAPAIVENAKSAQGAGDNMVAGIIKAYLQDRGLKEMLSYGTAAASGSLEMEGTGATTLSLFSKYLEKAKIMEIE